MRRVAYAALAAVSTFLATSSARASTTFPQAIQEHLDLPCAPQCTLCHATLAGGTGTIDKLFGSAIFLQGGARGAMPDTVPAALDTLAMMGSDVDGDGITDIDELKNGMNPNPGDGELCPITYGCGARIAQERAPHSPVSGWGALAAAVAALVLALRFRRRR